MSQFNIKCSSKKIGIIQGKSEKAFSQVIARVLISWIMLIGCYLSTLDFFMYIYIAFATFSIFTLNTKCGLCYMMSITSFSNITCLSFRYDLSLHGILILFFIVSCALKKISFDKRIWISYLLMAFFFAVSPIGSFTDIKTILNFLLLVIIVTSVVKERCLWRKYVDFYVIGHMLATILALICMRSERMILTLNHDYAKIGSIVMARFTGSDFDCNFFAANCALIISILLYCLANSKVLKISENKLKIIIALYFIFGLFTLSKMFIIAVIIEFMLYYLTNFSRRFSKSMFSILLIIALLLVVNDATNNALYNLAFGRLSSISSSNLTELTGRRNEIWNSYLGDWTSSVKKILIGSGMANKKLREDYFLPHNTFIEILYQFGVIGSIIFGSYIISIFSWIKSNRFGKKISARFIPLIILSAVAFSLGMFSVDMFSVILAIGLIIAAGYANG